MEIHVTSWSGIQYHSIQCCYHKQKDSKQQPQRVDVYARTERGPLLTAT